MYVSVTKTPWGWDVHFSTVNSQHPFELRSFRTKDHFMVEAPTSYAMRLAKILGCKWLDHAGKWHEP